MDVGRYPAGYSRRETPAEGNSKCSVNNGRAIDLNRLSWSCPSGLAISVYLRQGQYDSPQAVKRSEVENAGL